MLKVTLANGTVIEASTVEELAAVQSLLSSSVPSKPNRTTGMSAAEKWEKNKADRAAGQHRAHHQHHDRQGVQARIVAQRCR